MKKLTFFLLFICLGLTVTPQSIDEIINKYFESIGGIEKIKVLKTLKMIGTFPTPQGDFTFEMNRKAPDKMMISLDVMGMKLIPQAYDGVHAWTINPFTENKNAQLLPEDQAKALRSEAIFEDPFLNYKQKGHELTLEGSADLDGTSCYQVKLIMNKGKEGEEATSTYFIDKESYLSVMVRQNKGVQSGGQDTEIYFSDYQDIENGMIMPFNFDTKINGQSIQTIKFTSIVANVDIPDNVFAFPGE
jgi:outer membrane lipoprotein-sorting protein